MKVQLDPKRMRHVVEVARTKSITNAAETLGITQSALSRSIAEVEEALATQLFYRLRRGIQVTPAGARFVSGANHVLAEMDDLIAQVMNESHLSGGRLRVGAAPGTYVRLFSRALKRFAATFPGVGIEVITGTAQALVPRLLNGELDLMLGSSIHLGRWHDIQVRSLRRLKFAMLMRAGHPLTMCSSPPHELDVLKYPMVLPETVEPTFSGVVERCSFYGLPPFRPHCLVEDVDTRLRILKVTDAISPIYDLDFGNIGANFALLVDALALPPHFVALAHCASRSRSAAAERFESMAVDCLCAEDPTDEAQERFALVADQPRSPVCA